jgi:acetyltransferase-like isoleucine patch superfamily enzyme
VRKLVIYGVGEFGELAHHYFSRDGQHRVCAFVTQTASAAGTSFCALPVVHNYELASTFSAGDHDLFVAIGHARGNRLRAQAFRGAVEAGYNLASYVSPSADVADDFRLEPNVLVMERAGLQPFVTVGRNTVIGAGTRIGFHAQIGAHCWIDCALFGESVVVGHHCTVGLNATVAPFKRLGHHTSIGPGVLLTADAPAHASVTARGREASSVPSQRLRRL